MLLSY